MVRFQWQWFIYYRNYLFGQSVTRKKCDTGKRGKKKCNMKTRHGKRHTKKRVTFSRGHFFVLCFSCDVFLCRAVSYDIFHLSHCFCLTLLRVKFLCHVVLVSCFIVLLFFRAMFYRMTFFRVPIPCITFFRVACFLIVFPYVDFWFRVTGKDFFSLAATNDFFRWASNRFFLSLCFPGDFFSFVTQTTFFVRLPKRFFSFGFHRRLFSFGYLVTKWLVFVRLRTRLFFRPRTVRTDGRTDGRTALWTTQWHSVDTFCEVLWTT